MNKRFKVPLVCRGQITFIVRADDEETARQKAENLRRAAYRPESLGSKWEEIERFGAVLPLPEDVCQARDALDAAMKERGNAQN